ncbi:uncharacterized protein SPSK_09950 [Sporothrix schenckii 1099-18]|uniref:Uncharacterized protein n=1 Tax=Sporothrix schenckii 1099-18 TaxID=1397361 RepID=A0A0F2MAH3_SPOSC|nr:uncharacterized protein SPSK_09950 [Sporothrix schenckii 1099-18]KJR85161.1 hypothetical protein SPSK_09950 [Sporothrix schenckii 1099-18]
MEDAADTPRPHFSSVELTSQTNPDHQPKRARTFGAVFRERTKYGTGTSYAVRVQRPCESLQQCGRDRDRNQQPGGRSDYLVGRDTIGKALGGPRTKGLVHGAGANPPWSTFFAAVDALWMLPSTKIRTLGDQVCANAARFD